MPDYDQFLSLLARGRADTAHIVVADNSVTIIC